MKSRFLVIFFIAVAFASKAQTVTDPWATLGASNIETSFIVMDAANNLYVSNFINSTISKITPAGTVTQAWATLAGNTRPYGMVIDPSGIIYTVNRSSPYTISKITPTANGSSGTVIQTWATLGAEAYTISMDGSGNLFAPFVGTNQIAKIVPAVGGATGTVTKPWVTLATGANPFSISFDASGNLYSANSNNTISKITPAGNVTQAWATLATSSNPQFMVFDPNGNMYVSCWGTSTVSKVNSGGTVTDVWSLGTSVWPAGIVLDDLGNIYTANYNNHTISKITSGGTVTQAYATLANASNPFYLAKDGSGNLYTTNMNKGTVSKISYAPSVTITSSTSGSVCAGANVAFTANVSNFTSTPTYQWYKNGSAITGATSSTYSTTTLSNNDQINVVCANESSVVSDASLSLLLDAKNGSSISGSTWSDLSGKGNNATLSSDQSYSSGDGGSIQFNGGQNAVSMPLISNKTSDITMQTWVYLDANTKGPFFKNGYNNGYVFGTGSGGNGFEVGNKATMLFAGARWIPTTTSYGYGWKFVTMTINSSGVPSLYINGTLVGGTYTGTNALTPNTGTYLGRNVGDDDSNWPKFNGKMGAAYFYTKELTQSEITQNYNASATRFGLSGATTYSSNTITATIAATPNASVTVSGDACVNKTTLTTTSSLTAYAWYKDNVVISGATSNVYTPTANGVYKVEVTSGSCSNTSTTTTIYNCGVTSDGSMVSISNINSLISPEGGANFGTGRDYSGKLYNTTNLTTASGTIGSSTAVLGGVISATNGVTSSVGVVYSTASNFGTYSTTTIGSNVAAGTFTSTVTGLAASTTYYAKTFIVNSAGTTYGDVVSFTTSAPSLVNDGLVLNLDAGNSASYSGTGNIWTDLSGRGNNGTLVNTITHSTTNPGYLIFNGNGSYAGSGGYNPYVSLPKSTDFDFGSGDFTVEMWTYTTTANPHPEYITLNVNGGSYAAFRMEYWNGNVNLLHSYNGVSHANGGSFPITLNAWQHIAVSRIGGSVAVYVNGVLKTTYSLTGSLIAQQDSRIGDFYGSNGYYSFSGNISITKIYKGKGLTSSEVTTHFDLLKSRFGL